jgi:2-isopropylmalate synthase
VHLEQGDLKVVGRGVSTDVIEAGARAYVDGLNKLASLSRISLMARHRVFADATS